MENGSNDPWIYGRLYLSYRIPTVGSCLIAIGLINAYSPLKRTYEIFSTEVSTCAEAYSVRNRDTPADVIDVRVGENKTYIFDRMVGHE